MEGGVSEAFGPCQWPLPETLPFAPHGASGPPAGLSHPWGPKGPAQQGGLGASWGLWATGLGLSNVDLPAVFAVLLKDTLPVSSWRGLWRNWLEADPW